jgi:polysaccharide deacetylase family protein (PEP-CTERM system associated)
VRKLCAAPTFDVEDWNQTAAVRAAGGAEEDPGHACTAEALRGILSLLRASGARATFFFLGTIVDDRPDLAEAVLDSGCELACHGWSHTNLRSLGREAFGDELDRCSRAWNRHGLPAPSGFRAPSFSVDGASIAWVAGELLRRGYLYDSSVFPMFRHRYGCPHAPVEPFAVETPLGTLAELPLAVRRVLGLGLPAAGGAWGRFMPGFLHEALIASIARGGRTPVLYSHPWEYFRPFGDGAFRPTPQVRIRQGLGTGPGMFRFLGRLAERYECITLAGLLEREGAGLRPAPLFG